MSTTATLGELVRATGDEPDEVVTAILEAVDHDHRDEFLRGLGERIVQLENCGDDHDVEVAKFEVVRWVSGWYISVRIQHDPHFVAADLEATQLMAAGKVGPGATRSELRSRYARPR